MNDPSEYENCVFCSLEASNQEHEAGARLDALNQRVTSRFKALCRFTSFYLYGEGTNRYTATVLFDKDKDVKSSEKSGALRRLSEYVYADLERSGFGSKGEITVRFYFDSNERIDSGRRTKNIPTDDDFARADALDREENFGLDEVSEAVRRRFEPVCPLHNVYLFPERGNFRACVFFEHDKDIETCKRSGVVRDLIDFVYAELERIGRGKRGAITVIFEFDSDENVTVNYEADYLLRLR